MEESVLTTVKKILGLSEEMTHFDEDILVHINAALGILSQIGITEEGTFIQDASFTWEQLELPPDRLNTAKTWLSLRVKSWFDPPPTSFAIQAMERQIDQLEWRLNVMYEYAKGPIIEELPLVIDGGSDG